MEREHGSTGNALTHLWGVSTMKKPSAHGTGAREHGKRVGSASAMKKWSAHGTGQREHGDRDALRHVEKLVSNKRRGHGNTGDRCRHDEKASSHGTGTQGTPMSKPADPGNAPAEPGPPVPT